MPIDPMILGSMLDAFQNMYKQCQSMGLTGENMNAMQEVLSRIEKLGQENDDLNEFNAHIANENLFGRFSEYYTKVLTQQNQTQKGTEYSEYDDKALLKSCVSALHHSVESLERSYKAAVDEKNGKASNVEVELLQNPQNIIIAIQELIALGEQEGMTLPDFLRIQIERGLDKAAEGSVVTRNSLIFEKQFIEVNPPTPHHMALSEERIQAFDNLCANSKFGVPDQKEWEFIRDDIEKKYLPDIITFEKIRDMWGKILSDLNLWSLSYVTFAPHIFPWSLSRNPPEAVRKTQCITPGIFAERMQCMEKYFRMEFLDIFRHETFRWQVQYDFIEYSQEFTEFLIDFVFPACKPFQHLTKDVAEKRAEFHENGPMRTNRESNPNTLTPSQRHRDFYDSKFGQGSYENKYGTIQIIASNAHPWDLSTFKYT